MDMCHNNNIEVRVPVSWSVGHALRRILREISHIMTVVGLRYIVCRMNRLLGMLDKVFLIFV